MIERLIVSTASGDLVARLNERVEAAPGVFLSCYADRIEMLHRGNPRHYSVFPWRQADPFFFRSARVVVDEASSDMPWGFPFNGARPIGEGVWELVGIRDEPLPDPRYPESIGRDDHFIVGGERLVVKWRQPFEPLPAADVGAGALAKLGFVAPEPGSRLDRVWGLYSVDAGSLDPATGDDVLSRMSNHVTRTRFGGARNVEGWHRAGDIMWGAGHSGNFFDLPLLSIAWGLTHRDREAESLATYNVGAFLAWSKETLSTVWSADSRFRGMTQYEKGHERRGSYYWPATYKQWHAVSEVMHALDPSEPLWREARDLHRSWWTSKDPARSGDLFNGRYGERILERLLDWLRVHHEFAGTDDVMRGTLASHAEALIRQGMSYAADHEWFVNWSRWPTLNATPWMQGPTIRAVRWWLDRMPSLDAEFSDLLALCARKLLAVGTRQRGEYQEVAYRIGPGGEWLSGAAGPASTAALVGIPEIAGLERGPLDERIERTAFERLGQTWSNIDAEDFRRFDLFYGADGAMGSSAIKGMTRALGRALFWGGGVR